MKKNTLFAYSALVVAIVVLILVFVKEKSGNNGNLLNSEENLSEKSGNINSESGSTIMTSGYFEGILRISDNPSRGNLKLVSSSGEIYIRTERDFSNLVGLEVVVSIDGNLNNFELLNIETKVASDEGYIISN